MLYNCALNPLGALLGVSYGTLAEQPTTRSLMDRLVEEVFAVMLAAGYATHWSTSAEFLAAFYGRLVPDTAEHKSSMLQDITAGKRTEIDALTGAVITLAAQHGLDVPYNHAVYQLVRFIENRHNAGMRI
jgi:2-dehydropantoate 2-reductase